VSRPVAPAIALHDLTVAFDRRPAVHHVAGVFAPGSLTAIIGPNGAGKSTLLKAIAGMLRPAEGRVELRPAGRLAYLPQRAEIDRLFPIAVLDTVMIGFWSRLGWRRAATVGMLDEAHRAIAAVGLAGLAREPIGSLSVGQLQRVLFARLLVEDADAILLDEPFAAVDETTTADLLGIVRRWHGEGRTVVAVLHDLGQVRRHFPETLLLARTTVAWGPTETVVTPETLGRARLDPDPWSAAVHAIEAERVS
jgi:zinc/manganese transport system ATP-binding protein